MTNPQKRKGDKAEREAAELLTEVTGFKCQRNLSAGIPGDVGDIYGIPNCVVQVADYKDKNRLAFCNSHLIIVYYRFNTTIILCLLQC